MHDDVTNNDIIWVILLANRVGSGHSQSQQITRRIHNMQCSFEAFGTSILSTGVKKTSIRVESRSRYLLRPSQVYDDEKTLVAGTHTEPDDDTHGACLMRSCLWSSLPMNALHCASPGASAL